MRSTRSPLPLSAALLCFLAAGPLVAQLPTVRPSPSDAQAMLRSDPALVARLRARIAGSGLTPDQVRARLRAEGYPEHMLDAYLAGGDDASATPNDSVLDRRRA